jgi:transcription initiation factor TFIID subunit TAF12
MGKFFEIACLTEAEQERIWQEVERRIEEKKKNGLLTEREVLEIEAMKLRPLPDIQDVQSVYEDHLFRPK